MPEEKKKMKWDKVEQIMKLLRQVSQLKKLSKAGAIMLELCMLGVSLVSFPK
jgi:hypothetical protein